MGKDTTDLYAGGVMQQNILNRIGKIQKRGNSSYPSSMINCKSGQQNDSNQDLIGYV